MEIKFIPQSEFKRISASSLNTTDKLQLLATMCRLNTLSAVKRAGSGHLGSSFSAMDIVVFLYYKHLNILNLGVDHPDRDIYFSSKGHDVPGFYSVLDSLGILPREKLLRLRRLGGLDGHPDIKISGVEANTGSLGMGISKARGMAWAKKNLARKGRVIVMTGDGEWQEGQNFEALQAAVQQGVTNLTVVIDHNKLQSDRLITQIVDLGDLERKLSSFGWHVVRCNGHDYNDLANTFTKLDEVADKPKILIADTIKGRGVSFMEHPFALEQGHGLYRWHSGAPDDATYLKAFDDLSSRLPEKMNYESIALELVNSSLEGEPESKIEIFRKFSKVSSEYIAEAYGDAILEAGKTRKELIVLDGDLSADCRVRGFEMTLPEQFIENGIAEQDMVSMAGGLARQGMLPVVNSFASFLAARANEQIYNNATERTKIIYAAHFGGFIPAGPGKSHQSIRDIALMATIPNMQILQPCNAIEAKMIVSYCVNDASENCTIRMNIGPSPRTIELPAGYQLQFGRGVALQDGTSAVAIAYGPVMLHEVLLAADYLKTDGISLKVIQMPWLNRVDDSWLLRELAGFKKIFVVDDHSTVGGLGDFLLSRLSALRVLDGVRFTKYGISDYPACGTPAEVLKQHKLDGLSLSKAFKA